MFDFGLFWVVLAVFIGWATPQPAWAKQLTDALVAKFKQVTGKSSSE